MRPDRDRLHDIHEQVLSAMRAIEGKDRSNFDADSNLRNTVLYDLAVIGEAARYVSSEMQAKHPEVVWRAISDTRNDIIHGYFSVDLNIIWQTLHDDLAPLRAQIEEILRIEFPGRTDLA